jgi:hypothetical protein
MSQDLSNVRSICRQLCEASTQQFAIVNFTERVHVVTPHSIGVLITITGHSVFGKHVNSVGFCSARPTARVKGQRSMALNSYVTTRRFARDLEQIFANIKQRSGSVTITIYDNPGIGNLGAWSGSRLASNPRPTPIRCHGWQDLLKFSPSYITYRTAETFEQAVYAARRVRCQISGLKMDLFTGYNSLAQVQIQQAMEEILESSPAPLSVDLGRNEYPKLSSDSASKSVELRDIVYDGPIMNAGFNIPVDALFAWLNSQIIVKAKVDYIDNFTTTRLQQTIFTSHLQHLELTRIHAQTEHFDQNLWSETIGIISELPGLQHCKLGDLTYSIDLDWAEDRLQYFTLPGHGTFMSEVSGFLLLFPNGTVIFEASGDIGEELLDLANYVRAAENRKRQKIISDGFIKDGTVGIVQESG